MKQLGSSVVAGVMSEARATGPSITEVQQSDAVPAAFPGEMALPPDSAQSGEAARTLHGMRIHTHTRDRGHPTAANRVMARAARFVSPPARESRLLSLDALRGFAMFWIIGADSLGSGIRGLDAGAASGLLTEQFAHSTWAGFTFYDLIFPLFLFMVGVAITCSLPRIAARDGSSAVVGRVLRRSLILYVLGVLYYGGLFPPHTGEIRLLGVLQRVAICYFFASLLFLALRTRGLIVVCTSLLLGYWALMVWVPVPLWGGGDLAEGHNLANWVDREFLWGRKGDGDYDPEGLLSTIPAVASCLLGVLAGIWLRNPASTDREKATWLACAGVTLIAAGCLWGVHFPVIKKIWTSSYVLLAGGWSALLLAGFFLVMEIWKHRAWAQPLVWIGSNALAIYLISRLVDVVGFPAWIAGGAFEARLDTVFSGLGALAQATVGVGVCVGISWYLHKRRWFLRL